jgi:hypothetical protein
MDIAPLRLWQKLMDCPCPKHDRNTKSRRKRIVENFKIENRVPKTIADEFIECLKQETLKIINKSNKCEIILNTISQTQGNCKHLVLNGPTAEIKSPKLCFVKPSKKVALMLENALTSQIGSDIFQNPSGHFSEDEIAQLVSLDLLSREYFENPISNFLGIVWCTFLDDLNKEIDSGSSPDLIRNKLGLDIPNVYSKGEYLLYFAYNAKDSERYYCPTMVEGADFHAFRPSPVDSPTGFTTNLENGSPGLPEMVHKSIDNPREVLINIGLIGRLFEDPKQTYLEANLDIS